MKNKLLEIKELKTYFYSDEGVVPAVDGVDITIYEGETVGIVGESGCGKSVTSLTTMRLTPGKVVGGSIEFNGKDLLSLPEAEMRGIRGNEMAMIFQEPMTSLNPVFTIGQQIGESVEIHLKYSKQKAREHAIEMLKLVGMARPEQIVDDYPHQLSGGMRQRVMIAMAMSCQPKLLIADEPTTALDVTIQAQILDLMRKLRAEQNTAIMMITHDLGVVAEMCDRVVVMYSGKVVEEGDVITIFTNPKHPYTQGLMKSIPTLDAEEKDCIRSTVMYRFRAACAKAVRLPLDVNLPWTNAAKTHHCWRKSKQDITAAAGFIHTIRGRPEMKKPLIEVHNLKKYFPIKKGIFGQTVNHVKAVDGLNFTIYKGETLGLVGESGCGKSTTGRTILQLLEPTEGEVLYEGKNLVGMKPQELRKLRKDLQIIFQDPYASLDPRLTVGDIIAEPLQIHKIAAGKEMDQRVEELLNVVGLSSYHAKRYAHEFSGGQRQRIGIARALALNPKLIVADEPVSALDVSIQSQVINLLQDLQEQFQLTYLFIAHDLSVVKHISDRIGVMYLGRIVELSDKNELFNDPKHPYTKALLSAVPIPNPLIKKERIVLQGDVPSPANPPSGCTFHPRCSECMAICRTDKPELKEVNGQYVACHLYH